MADDPDWNDIFQPTPAQRDDAWSAGRGDRPLTRRELRDREQTARRAAEPVRRQRPASDFADDRPPRRRRRGLGAFIAVVLVLAVLIGGGGAGYALFGDRIKQVLAAEPSDYSGSGNGEQVTVVIKSGEIGSDVANTLAKQGVTATSDVFYKLLLKETSVSFTPGAYQLQKQMSAKSALAALQDPANRIEAKVTIPEGLSAEQAMERLSTGTGVPLADLQAAAKDYVALGVPAEAPSIEGFLFPATYTFDPGTSARDILVRLVSETTSRLDALGVAPQDRLKIVTMASIVQREAGPEAGDMPKIARVFYNRLAAGWKLQSDATVAYGTGNTDRVSTTSAERNDAANKYNTYANAGLPIGPIGLPGETALQAAVQPADGPWFYFVAVNLDTGETVFSTTQAEHDAAVKQWQSWCNESADNKAKCS